MGVSEKDGKHRKKHSLLMNLKGFGVKLLF